MHPLFIELKKWFDFGNELAVPSLHVVPVDLRCRYPVEAIVQETEKLIGMAMTEVGPKQFWKNGERFLSSGVMRDIDKKKQNQAQKFCYELNLLTSSLNKLRKNVQSFTKIFEDCEDFNPNNTGKQCVILARNLIHWKVCTSEAKLDALFPDGIIVVCINALV
jgi:hypothetical protein